MVKFVRTKLTFPLKGKYCDQILETSSPYNHTKNVIGYEPAGNNRMSK